MDESGALIKSQNMCLQPFLSKCKGSEPDNTLVNDGTE